MKEPTMEEMQQLVDFRRNFNTLYVAAVKVSVEGSVFGHVYGDVNGSVWGHVEGTVQGTISGRDWHLAETPKEQAIRLILEGRGEEAIAVLQESE
jgi:hypothetical protein